MQSTNEQETKINAPPFALYGRVSSEEQKQNKTIGTQVQTAEDFGEREDRVLAKSYLDDGVNGDLPWEMRPAARELLADARAGRVPGNTVAVYLFDRFSRDVLEGLLAARELSQAGITLFSLLENYDITTPQGRYMFIDSLNNAQRNKAMLKQRTADGMRRKARAGKWLSGKHAAYGYKVEGKKGDAHLVLDPSPVHEFGPDATRITVVEWMFDEIGNKARSATAVADELNRLGIPSFHNIHWSKEHVATMLKNTCYMGLHTYGDDATSTKNVRGLTAPVPAIVSRDLWERTKAQFAKNRRWADKNVRRNYLLRGLIFCGECGSAYCAATMDGAKEIAEATENRRGVYYRCGRRTGEKYYPHLPKCTGGRSVPGEIEHVVWDKIVWWITHPSDVEALLEQSEPDKQKQIDDLTRQANQLSQALDAKDKEKSAVVSLYRRGRIDDTLLDVQMDDIEAQKADLAARHAAVQKTLGGIASHDAATQNVVAQMDKLRVKIESKKLTFEEKREVVELVVERVTVYSSHLPEPRKGGAPVGRNAEIKVDFNLPIDEIDAINGPDTAGFSAPNGDSLTQSVS